MEKIYINEKKILTKYYPDKNETIIRIPDGVCSIGTQFLHSYEDGVKEIIIPPSVTEIQKYAFYNCKDLEVITFEDNTIIEDIGEGAFKGCEKLQEIQLPSIKTISKFMFEYCFSLKNITIPNSVIKIETSAFEKCRSLEEIILPVSVKRVAYCAFYQCDSLTKVTVNGYDNTNNSDLIIEGKAFIGCKNLKTIIFPKSIKSIESEAFKYCEKLSEIYIANKQEYCAFNEFRKNWDNNTGNYTFKFEDETILTKEDFHKQY